MLSIVKMDLDYDSGSLDAIDEVIIKEEVEEFPIQQEPTYEEDVLSFNKLELTPIVYTTRLDDMIVLKSNLLSLHPRDLTKRILKESKPKLDINPIKDEYRSRKESFRSVKTKLHQIYHEYQRRNLEEEELDIKPDIQLLPIDPNFIKNEVPDEPNSNYKFSELLKQCKPVSIELTKINLFQSKIRLKYNRPEIEIWAEVRNKNGEVNILKVNNSTVSRSVLYHSRGKARTSVYPTSPSKGGLCFYSNFSCNRLLKSGLAEIQDQYSGEFNMYCTDPKGELIDFYTDNAKNSKKYDHVRDVPEARMAFESCCWVRRDEYIQSLYPKVLLYTLVRFMKSPHLCPPGECVCCCKKREELQKPDIEFIDDVSLPNPPAYLKPDVEIQALENEIKNKIIEINKTPSLNTTEWLRNLLSRPGTKLPSYGKGPVKLIDKALTYTPPVPKKQYDNRRLLTIKQETPQSGSVIVFRNFARDEREIYELNSNGELQSYMKSTCFNNKSQLDLKKLSQKSKSVHDVCCWFKRENVIKELLDSKSLLPSAVKFIRSRHTCLSEKCSCCCQPNYDRLTTLTDITFPSRPIYRPSILKDVYTEPKQAITMSQAATVVPPTVGMKVVLPTMSVARPVINTGLDNINNAYTNPTHILLPPVALTSNFEPVPGPSSLIETTTTQNDDDCEIVSVTPASTMPTQINSAPTEQVTTIPEMVNCDDISEEVNSMIASILERFKDVRLTINSNGKVTAAINTPVNTLSTVEIKVLASILSYAQSQIDLLGVNSGMSLSSFISQSANINNVTQPESSAKISENNFQMNSQTHPQSSDASCDSSSNTESTNCVDYSTALPQPQLPPTKNNVFEHFSKSASVKKQGFHDSFASFLATKAQNSVNTFKPVIANVFSLKEQKSTATENDTSTSTVWYRKPGSQTSSVLIADKTKTKIVNKKRKQDSIEKAPKRLRVLSPSKLGAPTVDETNKIMKTFYKPIPVQDPTAQLGANKTGIISAPNPKIVSSKTLVIAPLRSAHANGDDANIVGNVTVPVTGDSEASEALPIGMTLAQAYDEAPLDDDCILGM